MSHTIIKKMVISEGGVFLTSAASNSFPREYREERDEQLSALLAEKGRDELDKAILMLYWEGLFHGGNNKYVKAEREFRRLHPEITWMNTGVKIGERHGHLVLYEYSYVASLLLKILKKKEAK